MPSPQYQQLNPLTPMAYLPPDLGFQTTISAYIFVACCGIMIWDVLDTLKQDYTLLRSYHIKLPTVAYFVSRLGSLGFLLSSTIGHTAPIGDCNRFERVKAGFYTAAVACTSLLIFLRVRAVFEKNTYIVIFFATSWLAVLGTCLTVIQGRQGGEIGPTKYCITVHLEGYISSSVIAPLVNDTLVFLAISWRLMRNAHLDDGGVKAGFRTMVLGDSMPAFSRALLRDGQVYYLTTVTSNLVTLIMICIKPVPESYRTMFTGPNVLIMNIMACRVFRNIRFGNFSENSMQSIITTADKPQHGVSVDHHQLSPHTAFGPGALRHTRARGELLPVDNNAGNIAINLRTRVHVERSAVTMERLQSSSKLDNDHDNDDDVELGRGLGLESPKKPNYPGGI